jgi:hypothetical protein
MKPKQDQLERFSQLLIAGLQAKGFMNAVADEAALKRKVVQVIMDNFAEEEKIEEEARQILASYGKPARDMDPYKMFLIAKQKLAAKKGFIL